MLIKCLNSCINVTNIEELLYFIVMKSMLLTFLFCFLALEGQQKIVFLEIYVLAMNIYDQNFIDRFE